MCVAEPLDPDRVFVSNFVGIFLSLSRLNSFTIPRITNPGLKRRSR